MDTLVETKPCQDYKPISEKQGCLLNVSVKQFRRTRPRLVEEGPCPRD